MIPANLLFNAQFRDFSGSVSIFGSSDSTLSGVQLVLGQEPCT